MDSQDIFLNNINRLAAYHSLDTYKQMAEFLDVTEDALKHWQNKTRCPTLKRLDQIGDRIGCRSYALIQKDSEIFAKIDCPKNNSREIFIRNLKEKFLQEGRFSWNDKAALFCCFVSVDALKSYFRERNFKTPPLKKLDEMASAIGIPAYELIKGDDANEKTDT
ncbi:hypothetical protein [Flintibacter muris]|uniref:hypothetical protein n=1 Tax=Flintibacter muris TaxID=2941327 RepID=UPI0020413296|nr:hypothetical protein [Flintibacter muris]